MNLLLISPLGFAVTPNSKYTGIEHLVWEYSRELIKEHKVTVMGHADSIFPSGVVLLSHRPEEPISSELKHYQSYQYLLRDFDVIHDFSHLHLTARFNVNLPTLNIFWHAPNLAQYPKAPYNIIALSNWAAREFKRIYRQEARYQESIVIDPEIYKLSNKHRNDRFFSIGRMAEEKGNLIALRLCLDIGVPLDVAGGRGMEKTNEPPTDYERAVQALAQTPPNRFLGEITNEDKVKYMQTCKALIYAPPPYYSEVTSHKLQEALFCGAPVITTSAGAMPEIITDGVDGFLCQTDEEYIEAIKNVDKLKPKQTHEAIVKKYSVSEVIKNYIPLYKKVKEGERW